MFIYKNWSNINFREFCYICLMNRIFQIPDNYSSELLLLLSLTAGKTDKIPAEINWNEFIRLAKKHRVIVWLLKTDSDFPTFFPEPIKKTIRETHSQNTQRMLFITAEMQRLQKCFSLKGIVNIPIKGPALAYQLFGDPGMRHCMDLDFLVSVDDLDRISEIMNKEGYKQIKPDFPLSPKQKKVHQKLIHHNYFKNIKTGLLVEIHWKLVTPNTLFPNGENLIFNSVSEGNPFTQIQPELLLQYLIIHGSMHRWYKLFWLKDVDEFFRKNKVTDIHYFNELTKKLGSEKMINQTFSLCELFFQTPIPKEINYQPASKYLFFSALRTINTNEEKIHERTFERFIKISYLIRLKRGLTHKMACLKAPGTNYLDWKTLPLPDHLFFLYYLLRPFLLFWSVFIKKNRVA